MVTTLVTHPIGVKNKQPRRIVVPVVKRKIIGREAGLNLWCHYFTLIQNRFVTIQKIDEVGKTDLTQSAAQGLDLMFDLAFEVFANFQSDNYSYHHYLFEYDDSSQACCRLGVAYALVGQNSQNTYDQTAKESFLTQSPNIPEVSRFFVHFVGT